MITTVDTRTGLVLSIEFPGRNKDDKKDKEKREQLKESRN